MATQAEIRNRAMRMLGILAVGATADSIHAGEVDAYYDEVYADLKDEGIATWASTAAIPDDVVPHVVALTAMQGTETYGISPQRYQRIAAKASVAKREIRRLVTPAYESLEDQTDY